MSEIEALEQRLSELDRERETIVGRLRSLRAAPLPTTIPVPRERPPLGTTASEDVPETPIQKIELFLKLFRCRESVYPKLWENKSKGTKGYSPVCSNEWVRGVCGKPPHGKVKCSECPNQAFPKLDAIAVESHLKGQSTIGTYAIRENDTCTFLACDFDGQGWQSDVFVYQAVARDLSVDVLVERSRSGNGAHAWLFFAEPVPARLARALGTLILSKCGEVNYRVDLESYDRFFPNQDYLPKGGFGNLIALPLQRSSRDAGNSVFIDLEMKPIADQWAFLSKARRLYLPEVRSLISDFLPARPAQLSSGSENEDPSLLTDSSVLDRTSDSADVIPAGQALTLINGSQISIPLNGLPAKLVAKLKRTASFPNPEFYKLQRMRMPTYPHPRFIFSGELRPEDLILPRGVLEKVAGILRKAGADLTIQDERYKGKKIGVEFTGSLTEVQEQAVVALKKHDQGVLVAPPGAGKTVMACALIARRKASTLILVHRQPLLEQWKTRVSTFLGLDGKSIGVLKGTKKKRTGKIDLAMLQTLTQAENIEEIVSDYGQVIIDECHHIPAISFENLLKRFPAKYILGLTATPYRKDGMEKILFQQCGPIRHEIHSADGGKLGKSVGIRETGFRLPEDVGQKPPYHVIAHLIATDPNRNALIAKDVISALSDRRFPLVISDRKDQLETLTKLVLDAAQSDPALKNLSAFRLEGGMSAKERRETLASLETARAERRPVFVLATASLIGEGFDMPELDALVLASPLSFEGRMVQYAGRLHRMAEGKENVVIYDYVDSYCAVSLKMYRNRIKAYRKMGYEITEPERMFGARSERQGRLAL